jgi:hypothetical protein
MVEMWHITLHTGNKIWDVLVSFFLMAYRATANTTTKRSPFYLLHSREIPLPTNKNINAKISKENLSYSQLPENLMGSLRLAHKLVN